MLLVTLGCSWTRGVGVAYKKGMKEDEYKSKNDDDILCDELSFRGLLTKKWKCTNLNFSQMGSSNDRQFRRATTYFKRKPRERVIVLWGITSVFRHEIWLTKNHQGKSGYQNVLYGHGMNRDVNMKHKRFDVNHHLEWHFDKKQKIKELSHKMRHWNLFFEGMGIENYWFDTFNHHDYPIPIDRMLFNNRKYRDLMSILCEDLEFDNYDPDEYHVSQFNNDDSRRMRFLEKKELVNPYSYHPTREAHARIAKLFDEVIKI